MCVYNMHAHAFGAYRSRIGTVILTPHTHRHTHRYMQLVKKNVCTHNCTHYYKTRGAMEKINK